MCVHCVCVCVCTQEFAALVNGRPASHVALAVARIRAYNAPALAADSRKQLQVRYTHAHTHTK